MASGSGSTYYPLSGRRNPAPRPTKVAWLNRPAVDRLQLWAYSGLALETRVTGEYRFQNGQLQSVKRPAIRGLNQNHNPDLKYVFKSAPSVPT